MLSARDAKRTLRRIIDDLDAGQRPRPRWVTTVAAPAALGLSLGLGGCLVELGGEEPSLDLRGKGDFFAEQEGGSCLTPPEICDDDVDNDGDGYVDCLDLSCGGDEACLGVMLYAAPMEQDCENGLDDDFDDLVDCEDPSCAHHCACAPAVEEDGEEEQEQLEQQQSDECGPDCGEGT